MDILKIIKGAQSYSFAPTGTLNSKEKMIIDGYLNLEYHHK